MAKRGNILYTDRDFTDLEVQQQFGFPVILILHDNNSVIKKISAFDENGAKSIYDFTLAASKDFVTATIATAISNIKDNTLEFPAFADFPQPGEVGNVYIAIAEDKIYIWDSTSSTYISQSWNQTIITGIQSQISYINFQISMIEGQLAQTTYPFIPYEHITGNYKNTDISYDDINNRYGIGKLNPTEKLDVNGNVKANKFLPNYATYTSSFTKVEAINPTNNERALLDIPSGGSGGATSVIDGFTSTSATSAGSANNDRLLYNQMSSIASGYKGVIKILDTAPLATGYYMLADQGNYINLGGLITASGKINFASFDGSSWQLISTDFDKILDFSIAYAYPTLSVIGGGSITRNDNITTITSSGQYVAGLYELGALTELEMSIYVSYANSAWYVIGTDNSGAFYMVENNFINKIYKVLPNGSLSTNWNIPTKTSNYTPNSDKKILVNGNNIKIFSKENGNYILIFEFTDYTIYGITKPAFGAVHYNNVNWGSNTQISIKLLNLQTQNNWSLSPNTIPNVIAGKQIVETNQFPYIGVIKEKSYAKTILYGDSISSTDYTWYKDLMTNLIGGNVYNAGFSGYTTAQLAQNTQLQRIFDFSPNLIIVLVGGNDTGAAGTVGSLTNAIVDGETIVSETDINSNYSGTYYIQAVSHIIRKLKSYYPNFRVLANLTGTETEAEKHTKLLIAKENVVDILFLSGLPQQRNNSSDAFSLKENNERKRQAVIACCKKYNVNYLDTFGEMNIDMSVEPFWVSPTDKTNNKGVLTMDGLHPNYFGYYKLCKLIYKSIREL